MGEESVKGGGGGVGEPERILGRPRHRWRRGHVLLTIREIINIRSTNLHRLVSSFIFLSDYLSLILYFLFLFPLSFSLLLSFFFLHVLSLLFLAVVSGFVLIFIQYISSFFPSYIVVFLSFFLLSFRVPSFHSFISLPLFYLVCFFILSFDYPSFLFLFLHSFLS
jgi:hypothetical protein